MRKFQHWPCSALVTNVVSFTNVSHAGGVVSRAGRVGARGTQGGTGEAGYSLQMTNGVAHPPGPAMHR